MSAMLHRSASSQSITSPKPLRPPTASKASSIRPGALLRIEREARIVAHALEQRQRIGRRRALRRRAERDAEALPVRRPVREAGGDLAVVLAGHAHRGADQPMERRRRQSRRELRQRRPQHRLPAFARDALPEIGLQIDEARMIRLAERPGPGRCGLALRQLLQPRHVRAAIVVELRRASRPSGPAPSAPAADDCRARRHTPDRRPRTRSAASRGWT